MGASHRHRAGARTETERQLRATTVSTSPGPSKLHETCRRLACRHRSRRIASRHDASRSGDLTSAPRSLVRGRTEHAAGTWITHAEPAICSSPSSTRTTSAWPPTAPRPSSTPLPTTSPEGQGAGSRTTMVPKPSTPALPSTVAQALWTLRGTQTLATATDWDALGGPHGGLCAGQRTRAHASDGRSESPKR
jgi:hypothetical protein